jgi:hypothetical protein
MPNLRHGEVLSCSGWNQFSIRITSEVALTAAHIVSWAQLWPECGALPAVIFTDYPPK